MIKKILFLNLFLILLLYPVNAIDLTIVPENPVAGDEITIKGTGATPNQVLAPSLTFTKTVSVANGKYDYRLSGVSIPSGNNNFAVTAESVKNINVAVKLLIWWTKSADAANGIAAVSQSNVPSGTYDIKIHGDAAEGGSSVILTITASSMITADAQGNFEYKYSTSGIPPGTFALSLGGITRTLTLSTTGAASSSSGSSEGGGGGGSGVSGEDFTNIELKEKHDLDISKDKVTSYRFTHRSNPIQFINITGNINAGETSLSVEVLKNIPSHIKDSAPGVLYKNINILFGSSSSAGSKIMKDAIINFKIENSWLENSSLSSRDIKIFRWDGSKWVQLETVERTKDALYTYYEAKTDTFSSFAISGLSGIAAPTKAETVKQGSVDTVKQTPVTSVTTIVAPLVKKPAIPSWGFALIALAVMSVMYFFVIKKKNR